MTRATLALALLVTLVAADPGAADIDRAIQQASRGRFWGAVLVGKGGEVVFAKGYGFQDYDEVKNTDRTLFEIASTSKQVTCAAVLRLRMDRKLQLDDTLDRFFRKVPRDKRTITVRQLMNHTSGISPNLGIPYASTMSRPEMVRHHLAAPLDSEPGAKFAYSNAAYAVLAAIVEVAAKTSFEDYCKKKLFKPAGMKDTGFVGDRKLGKGRVSERRGKRMPTATATDWHWGWGYRGMGGVVSTVRDMWLWDRALRGDKILDDAAKADFYKPALEGYAAGWKVDTTWTGTTKVHHSGGVHGYACNYVRHLEDDLVIVVLSNGETSPHAVSGAIEKLFTKTPRITASFDVSPYTLTKYSAAEFAGTSNWVVRKDKASVTVVLQDSKTKHAIVTARLPASAARKLRTDLERNLVGRKGGDKPMDAGAYLVRYPLRDGKLELDDLEIMLMPRYTGRGENGERIIDERLTLILIDKQRRQWPLMAKMDAGSARGLLEALRK
ncbi:MAG: serine hydrolase domain-containing protein [Planctomycetota bacterium]|jgi:CubicO group peptidase (beta-lactamase class C family)